MKKGMLRIDAAAAEQAEGRVVVPDPNLRIDFSLIARQEVATRNKTIRDELLRVGYPCLSDCMVNRDRGGTAVLEEIERQSKQGIYNPKTGALDSKSIMTWRLLLLSDEWGHPFKPGDRLEWIYDFVNRDSGVRGSGRKLTGRQIKNAIRRGEADRYFTKHSGVVDDRLCIEVGYVDAVTRLQTSGIHFETKVAITRKRQFSRHPREVPPGHPLMGKTRNAHNWLVMEVPPWLYDSLPRYDRDGKKIEEPPKEPSKKQENKK